MATLFPKIISYTHRPGGAYIKGIWVEGTNEERTFIGSVQPVTGKDTDALNIGQEDIGKVKIYSSSKLTVSLEGTEDIGDIVLWQGQRWLILQELVFQNDLIPHYKYIAEYFGEEEE
jgi:hypothetical protein